MGKELPMIAVAEELGVTRQMLSQHVKAGHVTARRVGGILLIDPEKAKEELLECSPKFALRMYREEKKKKLEETS
jgi:hypothetical protein